MRQYEPIWLQLKTKGKVKLSAPKQLHHRIIKAVMKERTQDLEYKFLIREANKRVKIRYRSTEAMIEMWLDTTIVICMETL